MFPRTLILKKNAFFLKENILKNGGFTNQGLLQEKIPPLLNLNDMYSTNI